MTTQTLKALSKQRNQEEMAQSWKLMVTNYTEPRFTNCITNMLHP